MLAVGQEDQRELRERRKNAQRSRTVLRKLKRRLQALSAARQALWMRAGVTDRTEFVACAAKIAERDAAARLLAEAQAELELLKGESPELAAVCDSLESSEESLSPREMLEVATDLRRRELELAQAHDRLAEADLEIEQLVSDCTAADLRFDLQGIDQQLRAAFQSLVAISLAGDVLEFQAQVVERRSQPRWRPLRSISNASRANAISGFGRHSPNAG
ncbi:MAG: hypothetical protein NT069_31960 [Planctomycetota bacterium]|nr:hypothetical protein [Planctomycetota bacterium]